LICKSDFGNFINHNKNADMKGKWILLMLTAVCAVQAQDALPSKSKVTLSFQTSPSIRFLTNNGSLNAALNNAGLHSIPNQMLSAELGLGLWVNRLYIVGVARSYSYSKTVSEQIITGKGGGIDIRFHYNLLKSERFFFGPYLGFGGDAYDFKFDHSNQRTLGDALASPGVNQPVKLSIADVINFSSGVAFLTKSKKINSHLQVASGLQLGYLWSTGGTYRVNDELVKGTKSVFSGIDSKVLVLFNFNFEKRSN
jgi:hypothetical protein